MASEIKWIKIVTDLFDDEKIQLIENYPESDTILTIWFKLLCLSGKCNNSGLLTLGEKIPYTDEMLATIFRRKVTSIQLAMKIFIEFGMVEVLDGKVYAISNWEKHQQLDALDKIREQTRLRTIKYREKQNLSLKDKTSNSGLKTNVCDVTRDVTVTRCDALESSYSNSISIINNNEDKEGIIKGNHKGKNVEIVTSPIRKDRPSSLEDVVEYMKQIECPKAEREAESYIDFYTSKGWKVGREPMKDWKAAARNWKRNVSPQSVPNDGKYHSTHGCVTREQASKDAKIGLQAAIQRALK